MISACLVAEEDVRELPVERGAERNVLLNYDVVRLIRNDDQVVHQSQLVFAVRGRDHMSIGR